MDERYHNVSLCLYQILNRIGASEKIRGIYRENAIEDETLMTAVHRVSIDQITCYIFGSYFEGSTTSGLNSDTDMLCCSDILVVERIGDAPHDGLSFLMVTDDTTKPGYVKLQIVFNQVAKSIHQRETRFGEQPDHLGRICLMQISDLIFQPGNCVFDERNGPALSITYGNGIDVDIVGALRFHFIPSFAGSWISRKRLFNWPQPEQIDNMGDYGCLLVGVNHPSSRNGPIEWRLSFSLQERFLMSSLNSTQHKCYILLKMIKKDIIHNQVPKSISSYHCKTCLFYAIENTPSNFWTCHKLLDCLLLCIKLLLQRVKENNCPNYFIPSENMFDRLGYTTLRRVQTVLEDIVDHWCRFIWSITCDDIGNLLYDVLFGFEPGMMRISSECSYSQIAKLYINRWNAIQKNVEHTILSSRCISYPDILKVVHVLKVAIIQTHPLREYTVEQTRKAINYIMPYMNLKTAQCLASIMLTIRDDGHMRTVFDVFIYYIKESKYSDVLSNYLIVASYCLQSERFKTCEKFLLECETSLMHHVVSVCSCRQSVCIDDDSMKQLCQILHRETLPIKQFLRTCVTGCIRFLPCEANVVTQALQLEMFRSVNTPQQSRHCLFDNWFDLIVVDSKVYMYLLQYVLYSKTNKPVYKQDAINNLVRVVSTDRHLGHRETAHNLLGWIYIQENRKHEALKSFLTSWKICPIHNAAKWHVLLLLYHITRGSCGFGSIN